MYPFLRPFLNRGGAGRSLSRAETAERLVPLVGRHQQLIIAYDAALSRLEDRALASQVEPVMSRLRTELAKLRETVYSCGGTTPTGVEIDPAEVLPGEDDAAILRQLLEAEGAYRDALAEVLDYPHHQMRTIAILENNHAGSEARLGVLQLLVKGEPVPAPPPPPAVGSPAAARAALVLGEWGEERA